MELIKVIGLEVLMIPFRFEQIFTFRSKAIAKKIFLVSGIKSFKVKINSITIIMIYIRV